MFFDENGNNWFSCFGNCFDEWRFDWAAIIASLTVSLECPVPKKEFELTHRVGGEGVSEETTMISRLIAKGQHLARKLPLGHPVRTNLMKSLVSLRHLLRNPVFVKCGQVGAALTAVEVGYDLGVCLYCTTECFSDEE